MTEQRCETCRFFDPYDVGDYKYGGRCHRNPPLANLESEIPDSSFPFVSRLDWCGEWQSKAAAEALEKLKEGLSNGKDQG